MKKHGFLSALPRAATGLPGLRMAAVAGFLCFGTPSAQAAEPPEKPKAAVETLGEAFIAQSSLRIYLSRPATISLHDARGQTLFQLETSRPAEVLPLAGLPTGFLYLTLRAGQVELTKKLVYTGK